MDLSYIRSNIVGEGVVIPTAYGSRRTTYCDYAASGRLYQPIEDRLRVLVGPTYANVHSDTSFVGAQTTAYREEARQIIKDAVGATDEDAVIFVGSGMTGAINTLVNCMGLSVPCAVKDRLGGVLDRLLSIDRPVVFISALEHHSNYLPWTCSTAEVVTIDECKTDGIDLDDLQAQIAQYPGRQLIGSFSAGSNVTGRTTKVADVARVMHDAGGIVFFDYAAAGPYVDVDMSICEAAFLSIHKFVGGPGSPGVLIARRDLFQNRVPNQPGGGTVSFVSPTQYSFLRDVEHREEGGTPNILGSIRAGLAMKLKQEVGSATILAHENDFAARLIAALGAEPNVTVLGDVDEPRLGIVSFVVSYEGRCLHHNFVVALLNDLFGIQARGGNSCAGPYAHRLLNVSEDDEQAIASYVEAGYHGCKPGWTRVSFGWYDSEETLAFVAAAILFVAREGWRFLPDYTFDASSGSWVNVAGKPPLLTLSSPITPLPTLDESVRPAYLDDALAFARVPRAPVALVPSPFEGLRWFWLPGELDEPSDATVPGGAARR